MILRVTHKLKIHRTFIHIWFLPTRNTTLKKSKEYETFLRSKTVNNIVKTNRAK